MVGHDTKSQSYASVEQQFIAHVVHTLGPWYVRLESSANARLLTPADRARGHYFKFFANALMRGAAKDRAEFYRTMYGIASLNPNEIRELEDLDPYDGGEQFRAPLNMEDPANPAAGRTGVQ
jgi:phage portal protein BeeE